MQDEAVADPADLSMLGEVVARSSVGVLAVDGALHILVANERMAALLGTDTAGLVGRHVHDALHGDRPEPDGCAFAHALALDVPVEVEGDDLRDADGRSVPVTWLASPLRERPGLSVIVRDDTVQRARAAQDEAARVRGRADLAVAQRSIDDLEWVAGMVEAMSGTLDESAALLRMSRDLVDRVADVVIADLVTSEGMRRVGGAVAAGVDVDLDAVLAREDVGDLVGSSSPAVAMARRGDIVRLGPAELDDAQLVDDNSRTLLAACGARQVMVVPLTTRGRVVGAVALVRRDAGTDPAGTARPFSDVERDLVADVAERAALAVDNARLYREQRDIALQLQHALLPAPTEGLAVRTATRYLPAGDRLRIGGDWYDVFACPDGQERTVLVIGDVGGHDLPAATTMSAIRNLLRGVAVATSGSCADVVTAVDRNLEVLGIRGVASAVMATATRRPDGDYDLRMSNAGHLPPLLLRPGGQAELFEERHGPLLGTGVDPVRRESLLVVPAGTTVVLYTDGLVETRTASLDDGLDRLRVAADALADLRDDPERLLAGLLERVTRSGEDDTAILVAHLPVTS